MAVSYPSAPTGAFEKFLHRSRSIEGERLQAAIPKSLFEPRLARGLLGFAVSWALYGGAIVVMATVRLWPLDIPLLAVAGLGGWGLHCIAHDCGHGSFSRSRKLNLLVGQISLLPLAYPFHAWRHVHNMHHAHTNSLELDTDWRPVPEALYRRMTFRDRMVYRGTRTWAFWGGTINYWAVSGFRPGFFPKREMRRDVRRSIAFVAVTLGVYLSALGYVAGPAGIGLYFLLPWLAIHAWFSATTLMHHSASDIPYLTEKYWTRNASRLLATTDYLYPKWLHFLTHNISIHTAHHVAPVVPYYNLPAAQESLKAAYPGMVRERRARISQLWTILRDCQLYDVESGYYTDLGGGPVVPDERLESVDLVS